MTDTKIMIGLVPTSDTANSLIYIDEYGGYTAAWADHNSIYTYFFNTDEEIFALADWLSGKDCRAAGYTVDNLRGMLPGCCSLSRAMWFHWPDGIPACYGEPERAGFESLYIGPIAEVYEWETRDGTVFSELKPQDHGETVAKYIASLTLISIGRGSMTTLTVFISARTNMSRKR
jgi:hypothetical protein